MAACSSAIPRRLINARTAGYLTRWYYDIGAKVKKGALLAEIATPEVDQQLAQAQADLATPTIDVAELAAAAAGKHDDADVDLARDRRLEGREAHPTRVLFGPSLG